MALVEHRTAEGAVPNSGVWGMRACAEAQEFLSAAWAQEDLIHHKWWENAAIMRLLGYRLDPPVGPAEPSAWRERTTFLDGRWNSIPGDPAPRPAIRHYPGYSVKTRAAFMLRDLAVRRR